VISKDLYKYHGKGAYKKEGEEYADIQHPGVGGRNQAYFQEIEQVTDGQRGEKKKN